MPIVKKPDGWWWGSKGPFTTKQKAAQVGAAAHAAGFKEEIMDKDHASEFVLTMLHSVTNAHIMHFQTRSYARHVALDRKSTRLNSSHTDISRMPSSA